MAKILVITGPTATGKTALGIEMARKFNGEIISADSQQVYIGRDVETGKDKELYQEAKVKIWGLDLFDAGHKFSVYEFVCFARTAIIDISSRGRLPIVIGGSGQYIKELLAPSFTLRLPPDQKLRQELANYSLEQLQSMINPPAGGKMNPSDWQNPRRLIRAIEVAKSLKKNHSLEKDYFSYSYDALIIGLTAPKEVIYQKVVDRRKTHPDLIAKEFTLAKKQLRYMQKFLPAIWFDITDPKYHDKIIEIIKTWHDRQKS